LWRRLWVAALLAAVLAAFAPCVMAAEEAEEEKGGGLPAIKDEEAAAEHDAALETRIKKTGELVAQVAERKAELLRKHSDLYALVLLKLEKARLLIRSYWPGEYRDQEVERNLDAADGLLKALLEGTEPPLNKHGRLERAYVALNDQSVQPYILYVPEAYDGKRPFGLIVYLHGYTPELNKENWVRLMYADVLDRYADEAEYIMAMPFARSNTDFQGIGEDDVVLVTRKVLKDYRIDPDRVVMSGYSMGGMGAWTISGHYPDLFTGLCAMSGRGDFYLWKRLTPDDLPPFKRKLAELEFGANMLTNYVHLPVFMMHGGADLGISVEQSRTMHARLRERELDVEYVELPEQGHYYFYTEAGYREEMLKWLKRQRRTAAPRKVSYRTYSLKYNRAYWVELLGIEDWSKAAEVTAEINQDGTALSLKTENVLCLRVKPPKELAADPAKLKITWNGKPAMPQVDKAGLLYLGEFDPGAGPLLKKPTFCGPVREAFADPFVMVHGPGKDNPSLRSAMQAAVDWMRFAKGVPQLISSERVDQRLMQRFNLFLFGEPETNPLMAELMPKLPIQVRDGMIHVGKKTYDAKTHGLWMVYPNPLAPGRFVVVCTDPVWGRQLSFNHKYDMLPDFIVFTDERSEDGTESNKFACAGFFDQYWRLSEQSTCYSETPR